jgi:hypothetical protein
MKMNDNEEQSQTTDNNSSKRVQWSSEMYEIVARECKSQLYYVYGIVIKCGYSLIIVLLMLV